MQRRDMRDAELLRLAADAARRRIEMACARCPAESAARRAAPATRCSTRRHPGGIVDEPQRAGADRDWPAPIDLAHLARAIRPRVVNDDLDVVPVACLLGGEFARNSARCRKNPD